MDEGAMQEIAKIIALTLKNPSDEAVHAKARDRVKQLCAPFPLYSGLETEGSGETRTDDRH
jgi:glycine hydroxymethyltransferase